MQTSRSLRIERRERRLAQGRVIGVIITAAVASLVIIVGVFIFSQVEASLDVGCEGAVGCANDSGSQAANDTITAMVGDIYDSFGLSPIVILVLFAGIILAALIGFLAFRGE